jgi:hypothetical protein
MVSIQWNVASDVGEEYDVTPTVPLYLRLREYFLQGDPLWRKGNSKSGSIVTLDEDIDGGVDPFLLLVI